MVQNYAQIAPHQITKGYGYYFASFAVDDNHLNTENVGHALTAIKSFRSSALIMFTVRKKSVRRSVILYPPASFSDGWSNYLYIYDPLYLLIFSNFESNYLYIYGRPLISTTALHRTRI